MSWERTVSWAYGRTVAVYARSLADVRDALPWWWQDEAPSNDPNLAPEHHVSIDPAWDEPVAMTRNLEFWVAEHATSAVFIHAAVVTHRGLALLLPGRSFVGKSALTAALVETGAAYGSDEYAVITPDGLVHAYPRRLILRTPDGIRRVGVEELGGQPFTTPARLAAVAELRFTDGASWSVQPTSRSQALMALLDNAVAAQSRSEDVLDALVNATASLQISIRGVRGDAAEAAAHLLTLLDGTVDATLVR